MFHLDLIGNLPAESFGDESDVYLFFLPRIRVSLTDYIYRRLFRVGRLSLSDRNDTQW